MKLINSHQVLVTLHRHQYMKFTESHYHNVKMVSRNTRFCPTGMTLFQILVRISGAKPMHRWRRRERDRCGTRNERNLVHVHCLHQLLPSVLKYFKHCTQFRWQWDVQSRPCRNKMHLYLSLAVNLLSVGPSCFFLCLFLSEGLGSQMFDCMCACMCAHVHVRELIFV